MTDMNVVPFGKYKGRLVEELIADTSYLEWLQAQPWFRERYGNLYQQIIINRGAEPQDSPEHNALQVLFLEDDFCLRLAQILRPGKTAKCIEEAERHRLEVAGDYRKKAAEIQASIKRVQEWIDKANAELVSPPPKKEKKKMWEIEPAQMIERCSEKQKACQKAAAEADEADKQAEEWENGAVKPFVSRRFEHQGIDVVIDVSYGVTGPWERVCEVAIELKPTVGDDYPSVLRQMLANRSEVLVLDAYVGKGATREQFVRTFGASGKRVVFLSEIQG
jgi:uncharacterized protein (DUF3820 family)